MLRSVIRVHRTCLSRINRTNPTQSNEEYPCETYIYTNDPSSALEDREWDFAEFMREKQHNWVGEAGEAEYEGEHSRETQPEDSEAWKKVGNEWEAEKAAFKKLAQTQKADSSSSS